MKKIFLLALVAFITSIPFKADAQTKEDLIACIEQVLDLDEMEPAFQHEQADGNTLYIYRPTNRPLGQRSKDNFHLFYDLTDDDFRYSRRPVRFVSDADAKNLGIPKDQLVTVSFGATANLINFRLNAMLKENREMFQGLFTFSKENNDWELTGKEVISTRR